MKSFKSLILTLILLSPAVFKYLSITVLVDVSTFILSALFILMSIILLANIASIKEGFTMHKGMYGVLKVKSPLYKRIYKSFILLPVALVGFVYAEATVTIVTFLIFQLLTYLLRKEFENFEWSEEGCCISKLKEEK